MHGTMIEIDFPAKFKINGLARQARPWQNELAKSAENVGEVAVCFRLSPALCASKSIFDHLRRSSKFAY